MPNQVGTLSLHAYYLVAAQRASELAIRDGKWFATLASPPAETRLLIRVLHPALCSATGQRAGQCSRSNPSLFSRVVLNPLFFNSWILLNAAWRAPGAFDIFRGPDSSFRTVFPPGVREDPHRRSWKRGARGWASAATASFRSPVRSWSLQTPGEGIARLAARMEARRPPAGPAAHGMARPALFSLER